MLDRCMLSSARYSDGCWRSFRRSAWADVDIQQRTFELSTSSMTAVCARFLMLSSARRSDGYRRSALSARMGGSWQSSTAHRAQRVDSDGCRCSIWSRSAARHEDGYRGSAISAVSPRAISDSPCESSELSYEVASDVSTNTGDQCSASQGRLSGLSDFGRVSTGDQ